MHTSRFSTVLLVLGLVLLTACSENSSSEYAVDPKVEELLESTIIAESVSSYDVDPANQTAVYSLHTGGNCEIHVYDLSTDTDVAAEIPEALRQSDFSWLAGSVECDSVDGAKVYLAADGDIYVDSQESYPYGPRLLYTFHENTLVSMMTLVDEDYIFNEFVLKGTYVDYDSEPWQKGQLSEAAKKETQELYCQDLASRLKSIIQIGEVNPRYNLLTLTNNDTAALPHQFCGPEEFAGLERQVISLAHNPQFEQIASITETVEEGGLMTDEWDFTVTTYADGEGTSFEEWVGSCDLFDGGCRNFNRIYFQEAWFGGDFEKGGELLLDWPSSLYFTVSEEEALVLYDEQLLLLNTAHEQ